MYEKGDFQSMKNRLIETNWEDYFIAQGNVKSIQDLWNGLKSKFLELRNQFIPKRTTSGNSCWDKKGIFEAIRN